MKEVILNMIFIPALKKLYKTDYDNIRFGASERNICARLALHIENTLREYDERNNSALFRDYYADVEYNRMGNGDLKHYEDCECRPRYMVSDLLIQTRGYGRNLLAVEMKRKGNRRNVVDDKDRLRSMVSSPRNDEFVDKCVHDTLLGAFILYSSEGLQMGLYGNVDGEGKKIGEQRYVYEGGGLRRIE